MIRIALIIPREDPAAWVRDLAQRLLALPFVQIGQIIRDTAPSPLAHGAGSLLWRLYQQADARGFGRRDDCLRIRHWDGLLSAVPSCEIDVAHSVSADAGAALMARQLDVIVHLGANPAHHSLAGAACHGIWQLRFGGERAIAPVMIGLREVLEGEPFSVIELLQKGAEHNEQVLFSAITRTIPLSPRRNRDNIFRKSTALFVRKLRDLDLQGAAGLVDHQAWEMPASGRAVTPPGNLAALKMTVRLSGRILWRAWQKTVYVEQWFVAYRFGDQDGLPAHFDDFIPMMPPKDRIWADPFPIVRDGRHYVFIEELPFATNKGHISVVELDRQGGWKTPVKVLERDYHMSYPFLFEWQGDLFMLPETGHNRSVELYRCHRFPDDWRLEKVLLENVNCADATLTQIGDRWWMFVNIGEEGTELYDELHLYHADQPFGPWLPHPRNPVKSDARTARPAGNLFQHEGQLYRPAQCCVPLYGSALSFNRVDHVDEDDFAEQQVSRLAAEWRPGLLGLHTFNRCVGLSVIDSFQRTPKWSWR